MSCSHLLLAIGFGSPWLLTGLVGAAIPIVIHLLSKRRYRESPWAAMSFLLEAARKHSRRLRCEQLLLLFIRCLAISLLSLAFSRPFFPAAFSDGTGRPARHVILVIDDSYSMGKDAGGTTRFDRARELAKETIESSFAGDAFSLLGMTIAPDVQLSVPTFRTDSILSQLAEFSLTERPANLPATIDRLEATLAETPQLPLKEVVILSDFQRRDWDPDVVTFREPLAERIRQLARDETRFTLTNVGLERESNWTVESVRVEPQPVVVGQSSRIVADLRRYHESSVGDISVELLVDGKLVASRTISTNLTSDSNISFEHVWSEPGLRRVVVQLQSDDLAIDNAYHRVVRVHDQLRVLFVEGHTGNSSREQSSFYLQSALATLADATSGQPLVATSLTDEIGFRDLPLRDFDVICLCHLATLRVLDVPRLREHLNRGRGLMILLGSATRLEAWNPALEALFPRASIRLSSSSSNNDFENAVGFLAADLSHPIVKPFEGNPGSGLETAVIWQRLTLSLGEDSNAKPVLRFDDGSLALIDLSSDTGRGLIAPISFDAISGSWAPLSGSYPPIAIESIRFLAASDPTDSRLLVGDPLRSIVPDGTWISQAKIQHPAGTVADLTYDGQQSREWLFDETDTSGFYEVDLGLIGLPREVFAVNVDRSESNLDSVSPTELRDSLFSGDEARVRSAWTTGQDDNANDPFPESSLISILLWFGLGLLLTEVAMAWRFWVGVICLGAILFCGAVLWAADWTRPAAAISTGVVILALVTMLVLHRLAKRQRQTRRERWSL